MDKSSGSYMGIGIALGVVFGLALNNLALGIVLGVAIGAAWTSREGRKQSDDER
jgi:hypothetical protein